MNKGIAIFDLTDTLINTTAVWKEAFFNLMNDINAIPDEYILKTLEEKGAMAALEAVVDFHRVPYGHTDLLLKLAKYAVQDFDKDSTLLSGAEEIVHSLREQGYKTAVICTGNPLFKDLARKKFEKDIPMDGWYSSRELGYTKADRELYEAIALDLGSDLDSCILFDNEESVIRAISNIGIKTVLISGNHIEEADIVVPSLCSLSKKKSHIQTKSFIFTENMFF